MHILIGLGLFIFSFITRAWIRFPLKDFGIDTWYFLNYAEGFRRQRKLPVRLKHYLLDIEEQWYPPFLPFILSLFPKRIIDDYHWSISAIIDSIQAMVLYIFSIMLTSRLDIAIFATFLYIGSTFNASMATNLNAGPLASLVFTLLVLAMYNFTLQRNALSFLIVLIIGILLLHTHKMATQQFLIFTIGASILTKDLFYLYFSTLIFAASFIVTKGYYLKILKNNIQIVKFWTKNLQYAFKHQVYRSPIYANNDKAIKKIGVAGLKMHKAMFLLARVYLVTLFLIITYFWLSKSNILYVKNLFFLFLWIFINYFTVIATTYFPLFKSIGEGFKYLIFGSFPASFLVGYGIINLLPDLPTAYMILTFLIGVSFYLLFFTLSSQKKNTNASVDEELKKIIKIVRESDEDNIMCMPVSKAEPVAYLADKKVLWGGHGSGWDLLDEFWPILKVPVENLIIKYKIALVLLDKRFVDINDLRIDKYIETMFSGENYILAKVKQVKAD